MNNIIVLFSILLACTCSYYTYSIVCPLINFSHSQGDMWEVYHEIASYLLQTTSENVVGNKKGRSPRKMIAPSSAKSGVHRTISQPLLPSSQPQPRVPLIRGARALSAGAVTRRLRTRVAHKGIPHAPGLKEPGIL